MSAARDRADRLVAVGYQWSFSVAIQRLKHDVLSGVYGEPKRLKTLVLWPRGRSYYNRNSWAGRRRTEDGRPVFDSPLNNATAHYLHNMLYVLGEATDRSVVPTHVTAELYRANEIENFDTAALRCVVPNGAELLFYTTHASRELFGPVFEYEFEKGTVHYGAERDVIGRFPDGRERSYGNPDAEPYRKLEQTLDAVARREATRCGIEAATSQVLCVDAAQRSSDITDFPPTCVRTVHEGEQERISVQGLDATLKKCYDRCTMPSEEDVEWARPGRCVELGEGVGQTR
jgi:predicted dehydrogenase